jgi:putative transposase
MNSRKELSEGRQSPIANLYSILTPDAVQQMVLDRAKGAALAFGVSLLEQDVELLCGRPYSRKNGELCHRGGSEQSSMVIDGVRYAIPRPRVRDENGEVELPMLAKLRDQDLLDRQMLDRMVRGVSTRNYDAVVGGYAKKLGVSKSTVSRAFVRASQKDLDELNNADLSGHGFVAIMIDGVDVAGRAVVAALGITETLEKIPLGVREGDTENSVLVKDLLASVIDRGFTLHCEKLLAVLDGAKALKKAVKDVFGERVVIQRCWLHKLRNAKKYLSKQHHPELLRRMKRLMSIVRYDEALKDLESLIHWAGGICHETESSFREVGTELLTVHQLGLPKQLRDSLSSTNAVESLIGVVRDKTNRVKNWKSVKTKQRLRWVASAIQFHRKRMRRLRGHQSRAILIAALGGAVANQKLSA